MASITEPVNGVVEWIDRLQRRHPLLGFPYAVIKRYGEDHGGWLGALISYYGFFSLYPLLVVFTTIASWVLKDRPETLQTVLEALWSRVPFVSDALSAEVAAQVERLTGHGWVLFLSAARRLVGRLRRGPAPPGHGQHDLGSPALPPPGFFPKLLRGLLIIGMLGLGIIGTAVVAGLTLAVDFPVVAAVGAAIANIVLSAGLTIALYHIIIGTSVRTVEILPGALITAIGTYVVTLVGGLYVKHVIARMTGLYGPFATTIGLLAYVSVLVQIFVFGTEVNVVRAKRLWPRAMRPELGPADHRAIELTMQREALLSIDDPRGSPT